MTKKQVVLQLLKGNKKVTLRMFAEAGVLYTARNRVSELRREGYVILSESGERPSDNAYILVSEPLHIMTDQNGQRAFA